MEADAHAVPAHFAHHAVAVLFRVVVHGLPHVAEEAPRLHFLQSQLHAFAGHVHEPALFLADRADAEHPRGVGKVAVVDGRNVHIDDVAVLEGHIVGGDTVADFLIDGGAGAFGEPAVAERGGDAAKLPGLFKNQPVDFGGGHARLDVRRHMVKHGDVDLAAFADAHDLFGRFEDASGRDKVPLMGVFGDPGVVWRACGLAFAASAPAWRLAVSFLIHVFLRSLWAVRGRGAQQKEIPHKKRAKHTPPGPHCRIRAEEAVFKLTYQGIVI